MKRIERKMRRTVPNSEGTWAVSYGDMITLLLAFFVLFYSTEPNKPANTVLSESLLATLKNLDQQMEATLESKALAQSAQIENQTGGKKADSQQGSPSPRKSEKTDTLERVMQMIGFGPLKEESYTAEAEDSKSKDKNENKVDLKALKAEANRLGDRIIIKFPNISFFGSARTELSEEGKQVLRAFAKSFIPFSGKTTLNIVGFTDERPVTKGRHRFQDNLELSVLRAVSAQRLLSEQGIPLARTKLMGFGVKESLSVGEKVKTASEKLALSRKIMLIIEPSGEAT